ncbi:MAG: NmrA family NAD(P)-binding protein [Bacteroidota bacterium]
MNDRVITIDTENGSAAKPADILITVFGATGMLAVPVVKQFVKAGYKVRAFVRDEAKAKTLLPAEAEIFIGNLSNREDIAGALAGADIAYLNLSVEQNSHERDFQSERDGLDIILQEARRKKIKRIVYLSSIIKDFDDTKWWANDMRRRAVQETEGSGIPFTIFMPSTFMECFPQLYLQNGVLMLPGKPKVPNWFIAAEDYARQVTASLQLPSAANRKYFVQGPEPMQLDAAMELFKATYKPASLKIMRVPLWVLRFPALFVQKFDYLVRIQTALNNYKEEFWAADTWKELGKPTITLKSFTEKL